MNTKANSLHVEIMCVTCHPYYREKIKVYVELTGWDSHGSSIGWLTSRRPLSTDHIIVIRAMIYDHNKIPGQVEERCRGRSAERSGPSVHSPLLVKSTGHAQLTPPVTGAKSCLSRMHSLNFSLGLAKLAPAVGHAGLQSPNGKQVYNINHIVFAHTLSAM